ncbi:hypothetical protein D1007_61343 [Hordeum vulgare]|nr:hypothetical protein D1007_61343 [Hordeum vulgare]
MSSSSSPDAAIRPVRRFSPSAPPSERAKTTEHVLISVRGSHVPPRSLDPGVLGPKPVSHTVVEPLGGPDATGEREPYLLIPSPTTNPAPPAATPIFDLDLDSLFSHFWSSPRVSAPRVSSTFAWWEGKVGGDQRSFAQVAASPPRPQSMAGRDGGNRFNRGDGAAEGRVGRGGGRYGRGGTREHGGGGGGRNLVWMRDNDEGGSSNIDPRHGSSDKARWDAAVMEQGDPRGSEKWGDTTTVAGAAGGKQPQVQDRRHPTPGKRNTAPLVGGAEVYPGFSSPLAAPAVSSPVRLSVVPLIPLSSPSLPTIAPFNRGWCVGPRVWGSSTLQSVSDLEMADPTEASGSQAQQEDPSSLIVRLTLQDDEVDDLVWEDEVDATEIYPKWLAIGRLLSGKTFSQSVLIADMRAAWNPAQSVVSRRINPNLFSIQFNCLADWNKAVHQGPLDFNGYALILAEYDGFSNPEKVKLDRLETWCQIHKLPDGVLKNKKFLKNLAKRIGEVQEVQVTLSNGFVGEFIRVCVKVDVCKKLTQVVRFTKSGETEHYLMKFEKLPTFYHACGIMGHWYEEYRIGEHDTSKFEWGPFLLATRRGRGGGRGGRGTSRGYNNLDDSDELGGRGRGRRGGRTGGKGRDEPNDDDPVRNGTSEKDEPPKRTWIEVYDPSKS